MSTGPGGGRTASWFDVERFRSLTTRSIVVRRASDRALVLGSTQDDLLVSRPAAEAAGVELLRRRSGGGAVLVLPSDPIWVDLWVPHGDALFDEDVSRAPGWVGESWAAALADLGAALLRVHSGALVPGAWSDLVCFAGVGPGEVLAEGRKVVGVAQWRSRQGSLFHSAAYRRWDPVPLVGLLDVPPARREAMASALRRVAIGLDELLGREPDPSEVEKALFRRLPPGPWSVLPADR